MEQTSEVVADGKLLHETSYLQRSTKYTELQLEGCKIDFYDATNKIVHEVKRGKSVEEAHTRQVQFYLWQLLKIGIEATGIIEYPTIKQNTTVLLTQEGIAYLTNTTLAIDKLLANDACPERLTKKAFCKTCSYFDFCWMEELE
jgi:CRISPR-associated exonuclease Cas4